MKLQNLIHILILIACIAFLSKARAVGPDTDGTIPGSNNGEGIGVLVSRTTGVWNTGTGFEALNHLTAGNQNTATGLRALNSDVNGGFNTATGVLSLFTNTSGFFNSATGAYSLANNISGTSNTADGYAALYRNTATGNTAIGASALFSNTTGGALGNIQGFDVGPNVAVGWQALESNTVASANTAVGYQALHSFTAGPMGFEQFGLCTAVGFQALANATGLGAGNNGIGYQALMNNTDGSGNIAIGVQALFSNTTGNGNVASGNNALLHNDTGGNNMAIGFGALESNIGGNDNIAIGEHALSANNSGNTGGGNIGLGAFAGNSVTAANNVICIGHTIFGANVDNSCYIGNIWSQPGGSQAVYVNSDGKLGALVSSRRFKEEIKPMEEASQSLFALKPVTFRYKKEVDPAGVSQFGLVAEEVEKVSADLVVRDKEGKPYSVRYDQVNAMLLNEFLKEHKTVQEQGATIAELKKEIAALTATVKEQAEQIQKVCTQIEASRSAPQVVLNNP